jgi:hypothetical protein
MKLDIIVLPGQVAQILKGEKARRARAVDSAGPKSD